MTSITARTVNELFREHMFRVMVTFHGGMRSLTSGPARARRRLYLATFCHMLATSDSFSAVSATIFKTK